MNQVGVGALCPAFRGCIDLIVKSTHGSRKRFVVWFFSFCAPFSGLRLFDVWSLHPHSLLRCKVNVSNE